MKQFSALLLSLLAGVALGQTSITGLPPITTPSTGELGGSEPVAVDSPGNCLGTYGGTCKTTTLAIGNTAHSVFNVAAYGAVGDGSTDDSLAISSACQAAIASAAYATNYQEVVVEGIPGRTYAIGSSGSTYGINCTGATAWNILGNGLSPGKLTFRNFNLLVTDPSNVGVRAFDGSNSINVHLDNVHIYSPSTNQAQIGILENNQVNGTPCCIWELTGTQVAGYYKAFSIFNGAGESTKYFNTAAANGNTTRGSIRSITITNSGGTGTASTTWASCPVSGGSGINATVYLKTNGSGALSTMLLQNWGIGYVLSDSGLTVPASGSCSGIPSGITFNVAQIAAYAFANDGQNHWNICSHWVGTCNQPVDTQISNTKIQWFGGSIRSNSGAVWLDASLKIEFHDTYVNSESLTQYMPGITLFDNGAASNWAPRFYGLRVECNISGGCGDFLITGTNSGPTIPGLYALIDYEKGGAGAGNISPAMFNIDPALTVGNAGGINLADAEIHWEVANKLPMFDNAASYSMSGKVSMITPYNWNQPYAWSGELCLGGLLQTAYCSPSKQRFGAMDIVVPVGGSNTKAMAVSCDHLVDMTVYTGPLCNIIRASDGFSTDLWADQNGEVDRAVFASFCANTTCNLNVPYDQSGNGDNGTTNAANRPIVALDPVLTNHISIQGTSGGPQAFVLAAGTGPNDIFTNAGGACGFVVSRAATGATDGYLADKSNSSTLGWALRTNGTTNPKIEFLQQASSSALDYITTTGISASLPAVVDVEYQNTSSANAPQVRINGAASTFSTSTSYSGTVSSDSGQNLVIGNNAATGGTNAYAGGIFEVVCFSGTTALNAVQLEAWGRAESGHYGFTTPTVN